MKRHRKFLALFLSVCMFGSLAAPAAAQETPATPQAAAGDRAAPGKTQAEERAAEDNSLRQQIRRQFSSGLAQYAPDDLVTIVVQLEAPAALDAPAAASAAPFAASFKAARAPVVASQQAVKRSVAALSDAVSFENSESFSLLLNGFTVTAPYGQLRSIQQLPGVKRAFVSGSFSIPATEPGYTLYTDHSSEMIGVSQAAAKGYTGKGTVIAVLDTGIEYTHEAFATAPADGYYTEASLKALVSDNADDFQAKVIDGYDSDTYQPIYASVSPDQVWYSDKIVYAFDYGNDDYDVTADLSTHGVHVAGIAAGHTVEDGETTFQGVAPDAQLAIMKVFDSYSGSSKTEDLLAALEDCVLLDVDVVNMSLGSASGFSSDVTEFLSEVLEKLESTGVILAVAAGNDTHTAANNPQNEQKLPSVYNPDYGMVASPSSYGAAFSVASVNNTVRRTGYLQVGEERFQYSDSGEGEQAISHLNRDDLVVVAVPNLGEPEDYEGLDVMGKVALIQRGTISFNDKLSNAADAGAVAAVVYDNEDSDTLINMQVDYFRIPSAFISKADGEKVLAMLENGGEVLLSASEDNVEEEDYPEQGLMSDFSSWGPTSTLRIKPEITAPGGNIYSSITGNSYDSLSGTSMACPHIAGAAAVMIQYLKEQSPDATKAQRALLVQSLLMSTAHPVVDGDGLPASVRQQGAGLIDLVAATASPAVLYGSDGRLPKAELGDGLTGSWSIAFSIENRSQEELTYTPEVSVYTEAVQTIGGRAYFSGALTELTGDALVVGLEPITLAAGETRDVSLVMTLSEDQIAQINADCPNGGYVEGFVTLTDDQGNTLGLPYLGFLGDWSALDLYDASFYSTEEEPLVYGSAVIALSAQLGQGNYLGFNYFTQSFHGDKLYFGPHAFDAADRFGVYPTCLFSQTTLLRNAEDITYTVTDGAGETLYTADGGPCTKTYFYVPGNAFVTADDPTYVLGYGEQVFDWPAEGETLTYTVTGIPEGETEPQVISYTLTVDETAPTLTSECAYNETTGGFELTLTMTDNASLQGARVSAIVVDQWGGQQVVEIGAVTSDELLTVGPDQSVSESIDVAELQALMAEVEKDLDPMMGQRVLMDKVYVEAVDYAWNTTGVECSLAGVHFTTADNEDGTVTITDYAGTAVSLDVPAQLDGKTVTAIGPDVFKDTILEAVTLPDTLTAIGAGAFQGTALTTVMVPDSVTAIGEKAFGYTAEGEKVEGFTMQVFAGSAAEAYAKENGFAIEYVDPSGLIYEITEAGVVILDYQGDNPTLDIPEQLQGVDVTEIGYRAFLENEVLTAVTLPQTLQKIGDRAFMYTNVGNMVIPDSVTVIEEGAFSRMPNLTAIDLPGSVQELPYMVFANDENLTEVTLHEGLVTIGSDVFAGTGISSIALPDTVTSIAQCTFQFCLALKEVKFSAAMTAIESGAFDNSGLETLVIPEGIEVIGAGAFASCRSLTTVSLPSTLTTMGEEFGAGVFAYCPALETVTFADSDKDLFIGSSAFDSCTSLVEFTIPQRCTAMAYGAFINTGLTSVEIPGNCKTVGSQAFYLCENLTEVTLREGVETIDNMAFSSCVNLKSIFVPKSVTTIGMRAIGFRNWSDVTEGFVVEGFTGSAAEQYVNDHNATVVDDTQKLTFLAHDHALEHVQAKPATEYTEGNTEYWYCPNCDRYYADEAATVEISLASTVIPVLEPAIRPILPPATEPAEADEPVSTTTTDPETGAVTVTTTDPKTGTVTVTTTYPDGTVIGTVTTSDGEKTLTVTDAEGVVQAQVVIPAEFPTPAESFTDISSDHWAAQAVNVVAGMGLFQGTGPQTFSGDSNMTRGMMVTVLHRLSGKAESAAHPFEDVTDDAFYASAVAWAYANGIASGVSDTRFAPEDDITREQLVTIIYRYAGFLGVDTVVEEETSLAAFGDADSVSGWASNAVRWAVQTGLMVGRGDNLAPAETATRAEAAAIIARFLEMLK